MRSFRAFLVALAVSSTSLTTAVVATPSPPAAAATSSYSCSVISAPNRVRIGTSYRVTYRYRNTSTGTKVLAWTPSTTNPLFMIYSKLHRRWVDAATPQGREAYRVPPGRSVDITFSRGSTRTPGTWRMKGVLYRASNGNTTTLMSGTPCRHAITFYR